MEWLVVGVYLVIVGLLGLVLSESHMNHHVIMRTMRDAQRMMQFASGVNCKENPLCQPVPQVVDTIEGVLNIGPKKVSLVCLRTEMSPKAREWQAILGIEFLKDWRIGLH